jgi:L-fuculokinase
MEYAIAALDIGKTNKKLVVYTPDLEPVHTSNRSVPCITQSGLEIEDTDSLRSWLLDALAYAAAHYPVRSIAVAAHGATFACIDGNGRLALPVLSYTNEPGEEFHRGFFKRHGAANALQKRTATLELPALINLAQGIEYAMRRFPDEMGHVAANLFYPQHFGCFFAGQVSAEFTYAGSHTYLWDLARPVGPSWHVRWESISCCQSAQVRRGAYLGRSRLTSPMRLALPGR